MIHKNKIRIKKIFDRVYHVNFQTEVELARSFLRFEEYYENPVFKGKIFTFDEFRAWYTANSPRGKKTGKFTYFHDWGGFNITTKILKPFYDRKFDPLSKDEIRLLDVLEPKKDDDASIIGTYGLNNKSIFKHEIAHGLFYTNHNYQQRVLEVVNGLDGKDKDKIDRFLLHLGYGKDVLLDETQAFLLDRRHLGSYGISGERIAEAGKKIKKIFREFYK